MKLNYQPILSAVLISFLINFQPVKGQVTNSNSGIPKSSPGYKINWTSNPFDHQLFIENQGQFTGPENGDKILYGAQLGNMYVFITPHGLVYKYTEHPEVHISPDKKHYQMVDPDEINPKDKPIDHYLSAIWEGSNNNVSIVAGEEQTYYYTYPGDYGKSTIKANVFKTVTCKNVYPGIDIKYVFPEGKSGFKYSLIVHPGADLSLVKLKYDGAKKLTVDKDGNIDIKSGWGQFVDHAPVSFYDGDHSPVVSSYLLNDNEESFNVKNIDPTKSLIIDPWSTNWTDNYVGTSGYDGAYDVDFDYAGNVYIYGGYSPYQLVKYNSAGVQQWTYNTSNFPYVYYGDFCVDKSSGVSFCFEGFGGGGSAYTDKISTTGSLITQLTTNTLDEQWRATYDLCSHTIAIAGGGITTSLQAATLDTNLLTYNSVNVLNLPPSTGYHDLCLVASDPIVDTTYMASTWTYANVNLDNNTLMRMPMPSLSPTSLMTHDQMNFQEVFSITYVGYGVGLANGMNGMAVSPNWLYVYDGDTLRQLNKNTGAVHNSVRVSPTFFAWGGLDVDLCDNLYVGNANNVDLYNSSLTQTGTIGAFPGNVFDVVLGNGVLSSADSTLYVCGKGFVSSVKIDPPSPPHITKTRTRVCSCNCTATGLLTLCGNVDSASSVSYLWSNGQTTHTATGLCPGNTYTLTIKLGCSQQIQDTFNFPLTGTLTLVKAQTSATCLNPGTATITVSGGIPPYNYTWSNGATTSSIGGLGAGNYCVTVDDSHGCQDSACFIIQGATLPTITITPSVDSLCFGGSGIPLMASGGVSYIWSPSNGLSCVGCPNPTATPTVTTTYTVVGTDGNGCKNKDSIVIKVNPLPVIVIAAPHDTVCPGGSVALTVSGAGAGGTYIWNPSALGLSCYNCINPTATPTATTVYTVTGTDAQGCSAEGSVTVHLQEPPTITVMATKTSLCQGQSASMTASATNTTTPYTWQPGGMTGPNVTVTPTVTTTYTVSAGSVCGVATATVTIVINPIPNVGMSADLSQGCVPLCVQFRNTTTISQGGISQYVWEFGNGDTLQSKNPIYCFPSSGTFNITLTAVSDSGCSMTFQKGNMITVFKHPSAAFTYTPQSPTILQPTIQFSSNSSDTYGAIAAYTWSFGDASDSNSNLANPSHTYQDTGTYCPSLVVMNEHGCVDTATNCLVMNSVFTLYIPSGFTPNGDGKNEVFMAKGKDVKSFEMYIFDRWGMQIFHSTNINEGWNGTVNGGSNIAQEDTYVYIIKAYDSNNKEHTYTGNVNLIK